jgi:DNA-binding winged helix-turn-helix (wHTH) protein
VPLQFGDLTFDSDTRQVWSARKEVRLSPKAFDLLALLIERRPKAVSKADIREQLWPGTFVSDSSLPSLVSEIRDAIDDHRRKPGLLRTLHGFGYAFQAEQGVSPPSNAPANDAANGWLIGSTAEVPLLPGENVIGREGEGVVVVKSSTVSRRHARIAIDTSGAVVEDLGSKNGTYVNDRRISATTPIVDGDLIRIGSMLFTFRLSQGNETTETQSSRSGTRLGS